MTSIMDRADAIAKSRGYIGIWSLPREQRERIIEQAKMPGSMKEILDQQMRGHKDPFAPARKDGAA